MAIEKATEKDQRMIGKLIIGVVIGGGIGALLGYFGKCSSGACPLMANPYRGAWYGAIVGLLFPLIFMSVPKEKPLKPVQREALTAASPAEKAQAPQQGALLHIESETDFKALVLNVGGIALVDLFSNRCPPCRVLAPTIASLADKYAGKVIVCKVNVDHASAVAERYGIRAIPTVIFLRDGKESKRLVGVLPESDYVTVLDGLIGQDKK